MNQGEVAGDCDAFVVYIFGMLSPVSWLLLPLGFYKLNVDASLKKGLRKVGIGCVIRDHIGCPVVAGHAGFHGSLQIIKAEAVLWISCFPTFFLEKMIFIPN